LICYKPNAYYPYPVIKYRNIIWKKIKGELEMNIKASEDSKIPKGQVTLIGVGRLGIRIGINLIQVHRGGPKIITGYDNQRITETDVIFKLFGAQFGDYKVDFLKSICTHPDDLRKVIAIREDLTLNNLDTLEGDVVSIQIAGGDTIGLTAAIIKKAHWIGAKTISTAGVFGIGEEEIKIMDISQADESNPVVRLLKEQGIKENHRIITTGRFIKDQIPITPYVLDEYANKMTREILKLLING
jgi:predicted ThiF/HesA family dinucleotide-utilizing enzyme